MATHLTAERRLPTPKRLTGSRTIVNRRTRLKSFSRCPVPSTKDDEESRYIHKAVIWIVVLATAPLILFHIVTFFEPGILLTPVTRP